MFSVGHGGCSEPGCNAEPDVERWSYTLGRFERGQPEFVVLGLDPGPSLELAEWADGMGQLLQALPLRWRGHLVRVDPLPATWVRRDRGRIGQWFEYYGYGPGAARIPAMAQLVWADHDDRFPDDPECDSFVVEAQPLLAVDPVSYPVPEDPRQHRSRTRRRHAA